MTRTNTACTMMIERLSAYLDGDLGPSACAGITRHARGCLRCQALIKELKSVTGHCRAAGQTPLPALVRIRARARMRALIGRVPRE